VNRLTAEGIAASAQAGERVLVVAAARQRGPVLDELARILPPEHVARVSRMVGIFLKSGGWVRVCAASSVRGYAADVVYLDASVQDHPGLDAEVRPCVAASPRGEIIRL
jgi:hypothetical protein